MGFLGGSDGKEMVKNLPAMWKTWVQSLGQEDLLEKGTATHSLEHSLDKEPGGLQPLVLQKVGHN